MQTLEGRIPLLGSIRCQNLLVHLGGKWKDGEEKMSIVNMISVPKNVYPRVTTVALAHCKNRIMPIKIFQFLSFMAYLQAKEIFRIWKLKNNSLKHVLSLNLALSEYLCIHFPSNLYLFTFLKYGKKLPSAINITVVVFPNFILISNFLTFKLIPGYCFF